MIQELTGEFSKRIERLIAVLAQSTVLEIFFLTFMLTLLLVTGVALFVDAGLAALLNSFLFVIAFVVRNVWTVDGVLILDCLAVVVIALTGVRKLFLVDVGLLNVLVTLMLRVTLFNAVARLILFAAGVTGGLDDVNLLIRFAFMFDNWLVAAVFVLEYKLLGVFAEK